MPEPGSERSRYWCCLNTRDGADTLDETLDSIAGQTIPPSFMVVVDDGSTDGTAALLEKRRVSFPQLYSVRTNSTTRDIRRVPILLNQGIECARKVIGSSAMPKYMMLSGDDNLLAPDLAASIMERMDADSGIAVASGDWLSAAGRTNQMPHGGGRFVRMDFMKSLGWRYPVAYGWETWLLYKAMQRGFKVKTFSDIRYKHLRPYRPKNIAGWGRGMYSLGFPSVFVTLRFGLNLIWTRRGTQTAESDVMMMAGYLSAKVNPGPLGPNLISDDGLKAFVRRYTMSRLTRLPW